MAKIGIATVKKKIKYIEYNSKDFKKNKRPKGSGGRRIGKTWKVTSLIKKRDGDLNISMMHLAVYTALAMISNVEDYYSEVAAFARSYMIQISALIDTSVNAKVKWNEYLAFKHENRYMLRDFSKSTRVGEIAQGINYYYARKILKALAIYNFDLFCDINIINRNKIGRKPDYVLVYDDGSTGVLESKGTMDSDVTEMLESGDDQIENGVKVLKADGIQVKDSYVMAVSFTFSRFRKRKTTLYISDPKEKRENEIFNPVRAIMYEYAKYFYLTSNEELYKYFSSFDTKQEVNPPVDSGLGYKLADLQFDGLDGELEIGIDKKVWTGLEKLHDLYKEDPEFKDSKAFENIMKEQYFDYKEKMGEDYCLLNDGVYFKFKSSM